MKLILLLLIVFNIFSSLVLSSDEIVLKSGEKIAGTVDLTQETQEKIVLRIRGEDGITVEKDIPKQDIVEIIWDQGVNDPAFALKLGENSQDVDWYKPAIVNQLKPWLERYPKSQHVQAMKDKLDAFTAEHLCVQNGDLRIGEKWYTAAEYEKARPELEAEQLLRQIRAAAVEFDYILVSDLLKQALVTYRRVAEKVHGSVTKRWLWAGIEMAARMSPNDFSIRV